MFAYASCINNYVLSNTVPTAPPENLQLFPQDPRTLLLTWQPPVDEHGNGIITGYVINITETETETQFQLVTEQTSIIVDSLHPFYTYSCIVAAKTVIGIGPFTVEVDVEMPEAGRYCILL